MCDCKKVALNPVHWMNKDLEEPTLVSIPDGLAQVDGKWIAVTISEVTLNYASRKRPVKATMIHSFCPFCGVKYGEEVSHG